MFALSSLCLVLASAVGAPLATQATSFSSRPTQRVDLELQDADIHQVLRLFSEIGGVNIIARAGVSGRVTARLQGVPWEEALVQILASLQLEAVRDGNVIYVSPRS